MNTAADNTRTARMTVTPCAATTTADQYDHVAAAEYLMKHAGTTAIAVLDGQQSNQPIGCITETDIAEAMAHGKDPNDTRIRELIGLSGRRSAGISAH